MNSFVERDGEIVTRQMFQLFARNPIATWLIVGSFGMAPAFFHEEPNWSFVPFGILVGAIASICSSIYRWNLARSVKSWQAAAGVIVRTAVEVGSGDPGNSYFPVVVYEYSYGGRSYRGSQVTLDMTPESFGFARRSNAEEIREGYPAGSAVTVFVNPTNPGQAALDRSFEMSDKAAAWCVGIAVAAALICLLMLL